MKRLAMLAATSAVAFLLTACGEHAPKKPETATATVSEQAHEVAPAAEHTAPAEATPAHPATEPGHPEAVVEGHPATADEAAGATSQE